MILHLLQASFLFPVGSGYVPDIQHCPELGTRQGDPFSLALFSLVVLLLIHSIKRVCPDAIVLMYVDDVIISFLGAGDAHK